MKKVAIIAAALLFTAAFVHAQTPSLTYAVAMTSSGWGQFTDDVAGQTGQRRMAEGIRVRVNSDVAGTVKYRVFAGGRWGDWKYHNEIAGDIGQQRFITSIQVELTGELDDRFDVQYTVFQGGNWTPWVANGADGGATGARSFVEGMQIILTENRAGRRPQGGKRAAPPPPPAPPGQGRRR